MTIADMRILRLMCGDTIKDWIHDDHIKTCGENCKKSFQEVWRVDCKCGVLPKEDQRELLMQLSNENF